MQRKVNNQLSEEAVHRLYNNNKTPFANCVLEKWLIFRMHKEPQTLNTPKIRHLIINKVKDWVDHSQRKKDK